MPKFPNLQDKYAVMALIDPDESLQSELWNNKLSATERAQIIQQIREFVGLPEFAENECRREYFAEGIFNETEFSKTDSVVIKLKPEIKVVLQERAVETLTRVKV